MPRTNCDNTACRAYVYSREKEVGVCSGASLIINHVEAIGDTNFPIPMTKEAVKGAMDHHWKVLNSYCGNEYFALKLTIEWAQQQIENK